MDTTFQIQALRQLAAELNPVLPKRFLIREVFANDQDLHAILWDADEEREFVLHYHTTAKQVITRLLACQREVGQIEGREEVRAPIKAALGL